MKSKIPYLILLLFCAFPSTGCAQGGTADSLKRIVRSTSVDTVRVNAYNHLSGLYRESHPDSAAFYADRARALARKSGYGYGMAMAHLNRGNACLLSGDYPEAMSLFRKAQAGFSALLGDDPRSGRFKNALGRAFASSAVVFSEQSDYARSLSDYQKALRLFTETGNRPMVSRVYNNISVIYKSMGNRKKALEYLHKAFALQRETGEQSAAVTLMNIGVVHFEMGDREKAADCYRRAERLFGGTDNQRGLALLYNYWGDYYAKAGNVAKADGNYRRSVSISERMQNKFGASLALYNLGLLYASEDPRKALAFALKSSDYAAQIGMLNQRYHSEKLASMLYEALGQPQKALVHYRKYVAFRDSILNQESARRFALAEMNFEYQKKEALLKEENKRQTQLLALSALAALLSAGLIVVLYNRRQVKRRLTLQKEVAEYEQKALHLQMNPHFVFNCLGSISSFIVQNGTDSALRYLSKFSKLMRLTLEYSKGSLIPIDKEIESLQNYLELEQLRFHHKFEFEIRSGSRVEFNMGLPPLLIQPFVENAILHGMVPKEGNGHICVDFDVSGGQLVCTVTDDGIGIVHSKQLKENSVTAHKSMALDITRKRLEIMESTTSKAAQIEISEIGEGMGTKVTLRLPVQYIP